MASRIASLACAVLLALGVSTTANATLTVLGTQAAFNAAVLNPATDTFDDLTGAPQTSPLARTVSTYSYSAAIANGIFAAGTAGDRWLAGDTATDAIVLSAFGGGVEAVGGFFFNTDINGALQSGRSVTIVFEDQDDSETVTLNNTTAASFVGVTSDGSIQKVTVTGVQAVTGGDFTWPTVNDLILAQVGDQSSNGTPEPGTVALLGLAGLALGARRRKTR